MSLMNPVLPNTSAEVARIAFSLFVHVADIEKNISAHDVRRFQVLLSDTAWIDNADLKAGLLELKERYSSFWANYEDGVFATDSAAVSDALARVERYIGHERGKQLKHALGRFLILLDRGSRGKLGQKENAARVQAKKQLAAILIEEASLELVSASIHEDTRALAGPISPTVASGFLDRSHPAEDMRALPSTALPQARQPEAAHAPQVQVAASSPDLVFLPRPDQGEVWSGRSRLRCVSVVAETHDTKTYSFAGEPGLLFHYRPGQAVTIEIPINGTVLRRTYTISSSPSRPYLLSITVKKVPMGWASNWLFDNMKPGVECMASAPFGRFSCTDRAAQKMLFMAAGSGVTPIMSMLRWLADMAHEIDAVFLYNVATPADIIFHQELLHLATRFDHRLRLVIVPARRANGLAWNGTVGRLSKSMILSHVEDLAERETYVCGPAGYMASAKSVLLSLGLPESRYHQEAFGAAKAIPAALPAPEERRFSSAPAPAPVAVEVEVEASVPVAQPTVMVPLAPPKAVTELPAVQSTTVVVAGKGERFTVAQDQTILEAADSAGVDLAHSCRAGNCGACRVKKTSGAIRMEDGHCLSEDELRDGYILTCMARPISTQAITVEC